MNQPLVVDSLGRPASASDAAHWHRVVTTLRHCAERVPLYRGIEPPAAEGDPAVEGPRALARFPLLDKTALRRAFPLGLVPDGARLPELLRNGTVSFVGTSGTTGERVQVLWHEPWWNAQERDGFALHPLTDRHAGAPDYREAILTTPVCSGNLCHVGKLPMAERIVDGAMLFLNQTPDPGMWSDLDVLRMADELEEFAPHALECDPAYLAYFADRLARIGRRPFQPAFIDHSYEFPSRRHLAAIARVFDVPILDAYGSTECGFAFMQCPQGRYHHNARWTHAEVLPIGDGAVPGLDGVGRLVLTTLDNPWLNLVRFDTGDLVRIATAPCGCGRNDSLVLDALEGRSVDCVQARDGSWCTVRAVDAALAEFEWVLNWRLRQHGAAEFTLDVLPSAGAAGVDPNATAVALAQVLGMAPRTRIVASLPVEASGKYRLCEATHVDVAAALRGTP